MGRHAPLPLSPNYRRQCTADDLRLVPEESSGGTSDARFIASLGAEVIEMGPINASIHKIDECINVD